MTIVRRRWLAGAIGAVAVAAAATAVVVRRGGDEPAVRSPALVVPATRAVETRFTGAHYAAHRPYRSAPHESVALEVLAGLERRGERGDLIAALASSGDPARAGRVLGEAPGAAADADRAAIALIAGDAERALADGYRAVQRDPALGAAWWNLALAARARGLLRVSRAGFERVVALAEPGWADEARAHIAALGQALAPRDELAGFDARGRAMVDGGAAITPDDVRRFPAFARVYLLDAIRLATPERLAALRPLAEAMDATMTAAIDRAAAEAPALRARFAPAYRKLIARTASPAEIDQLITALGTAGLDDLRAGAIITGGRAAARLAELAAVTAPWRDPWFELVVARAQIQHDFPAGDLRAEPALAQALAAVVAHDPGDGFALRVGQLAQDLAQLLSDSGREQDAEPWAARAVDDFARTVAAVHLETARADLGGLHRQLGRTALARAELEEVVLAVGDGNCHLRRFAAIALADLALGRQDWDAVRALLPPAVPPDGCAEALVLQGVATATDLARRTGEPRDADTARQWIAAVRGIPHDVLHDDRDGVAAVATARLRRGQDPAATAAVHAWLATHPGGAGAAPDRIAARTWGFTTLVTDAAARRDWPGVMTVAGLEHPQIAAAPCAVVVGLDDGELTVAARTTAGVVGEQRRIDPQALAATTLVPAAITGALTGCAAIAVDARPPLHGRADVLPAALPWWFASDAERPAGARRGAAAITVTDPRPPDRSLPALAPAEPSGLVFATALSGDAATPRQVLAALGAAGYAELHVHGVAAAHNEDAAFLALSPDPDGAFTLTADQVRHAHLGNAPLIVLAACRAGAVAAYLRQRWSLPDAFVAAGASAVVAVDVPIPDRGAQAMFDDLHRQIDRGVPVEAAVAALRAAAGDASWVRHLMVFR